jgi:hypothetical protein
VRRSDVARISGLIVEPMSQKPRPVRVWTAKTGFAGQAIRSLASPNSRELEQHFGAMMLPISNYLWAYTDDPSAKLAVQVFSDLILRLGEFASTVTEDMSEGAAQRTWWQWMADEAQRCGAEQGRPVLAESAVAWLKRAELDTVGSLRSRFVSDSR